MKKLILHVGPHKTGSTYLQLKLMGNRHKLSEFGLSYPSSFFYLFGHHYLCSKMFNKNKREEFLSSIDEINSIEGDVILSSENYSTQNIEFYEHIKKFFKYEEVIVVYYYRTPTDRLYSYWQEQVKHGSSESFSEYSLSKFSRPYSNGDLNYIPYLDMLEQVFGKSALKIIDYNDSLKNNSAVSLFFKAIGSECDIKDSAEVVNAMLPLSTIEVVRALNAKKVQLGGKPNLKLREAFMASSYDENEDYLYLKEVIEKNCVKIKLGDTYIDRQVHSQLIKKYSDNIVGKFFEPKESLKLIPNSDWIYFDTCMNRLENIYNNLELS